MRIFRLSSLVRIVTHNRYCRYELDIYSKFKLLIDSLLVILPMILKFIPLILITWFVFGVIGMEIFYNDIFLTKTQYSTYD